MKILLTRSMLPGDIQYIRDGLDREIPGRYDFIVPEAFTEEALCALSADADVLLGPFVTPKLLDAAKGLKLIQVPWTGMDTFDFSAVRGRGVPVCNTHSNASAVAELGITLLLDLLKKVSYHDRKMRAGNWNRDQAPLSLKSVLLSAQTVCVLGYGNIGSRLGALCQAFGARVLAVDDRRGKAGVTYYGSAEMDRALAEADAVICTLPLTDSTRGLLGAEKLHQMKRGAVLVNMSRAALVDEDALWDALCDGQVGGFASDVWWSAPKRGESQSYPSAKHPFHTLDQVVMSPHRAGFLAGCLPHLDGAIANLIALETGAPLSDRVDTEKGY